MKNTPKPVNPSQKLNMVRLLARLSDAELMILVGDELRRRSKARPMPTRSDIAMLAAGAIIDGVAYQITSKSFI